MKYNEYINIVHYKKAREQELSSRDEAYGGAPFEERYRNQDIQELIERIPLQTTSAILVIGTGTGADSCWLADQGYQVTGIDIAQDAITIAREIAQKRGTHITYYQDDISNIHNTYGKFDAIIDSFCLQSIVLDAERANVFSFVKNHLREAGYYIIVSAGFSENKTYNETYFRDEKTGIVYQEAKEGEMELEDIVILNGTSYLPVRRHYTLDVLTEELKGKGFNVIYANTEEAWGALKVISTL